MTEEEAGIKWCPFVRAAYSGITASFNRGVKDLDDGRLAVDLHIAHCIGSRCMLWRDDAVQEIGTNKMSNGNCVMNSY